VHWFGHSEDRYRIKALRLHFPAFENSNLAGPFPQLHVVSVDEPLCSLNRFLVVIECHLHRSYDAAIVANEISPIIAHYSAFRGNCRPGRRPFVELGRNFRQAAFTQKSVTFTARRKMAMKDKKAASPSAAPTPTTGAPKGLSLDPLTLLRQAMSAVPSVKYALGVVGVGAAISIVLSLLADVRIALIGVPIMVAFMVLLLVFQRLSVLESGHFKYPALMLLWVFPILIAGFLCLLFSSVFFSWPLDLKHWIQGDRPKVSTPAQTKPEAFMTIAPVSGSTPYQAYRLKTLPPTMSAQRGSVASGLTGFFLWKELDFDVVLFAINAGTEIDASTYMDRQTFIAGGEAGKRALLERTWKLFEGIGTSWRSARDQRRVPAAQIKLLEPILSSLSEDPGTAGLAILRNIYFREHERDHQQRKAIADALITTGDLLMPAGSEIVAGPDDRLDEAARLLATKRIQPLLDVTITNPHSDPIVVTSVRLDVLEVATALSAMESGPLTFVDTVKFELTDKPGSQAKSLSKPIKIAPKDAVTIRVELRSNYLFSYLCRLVVVGGGSDLGTGPAFIVDYGFQPPSDAIPL
jgi:hypothetical protein